MLKITRSPRIEIQLKDGNIIKNGDYISVNIRTILRLEETSNLYGSIHKNKLDEIIEALQVVQKDLHA